MFLPFFPSIQKLQVSDSWILTPFFFVKKAFEPWKKISELNKEVSEGA